MKTPIKAMIAGILLFSGGLLLALGGSLLGMTGAFARVADSATPASPSQLAEGIPLALFTSAIGIPISLIGLCLAIGGLIAWLIKRQ